MAPLRRTSSTNRLAENLASAIAPPQATPGPHPAMTALEWNNGIAR
ncbi:MAG TPA: hypothetical protein VK964_20645 [Nocardioidaceae bacterium]|nr:hypothetical protein [Nocardioidaceae bacterium]